MIFFEWPIFLKTAIASLTPGQSYGSLDFAGTTFVTTRRRTGACSLEYIGKNLPIRESLFFATANVGRKLAPEDLLALHAERISATPPIE